METETEISGVALFAIDNDNTNITTNQDGVVPTKLDTILDNENKSESQNEVDTSPAVVIEEKEKIDIVAEAKSLPTESTSSINRNEKHQLDQTNNLENSVISEEEQIQQKVLQELANLKDIVEIKVESNSQDTHKVDDSKDAASNPIEPHSTDNTDVNLTEKANEKNSDNDDEQILDELDEVLDNTENILDNADERISDSTEDKILDEMISDNTDENLTENATEKMSDNKDKNILDELDEILDNTVENISDNANTNIPIDNGEKISDNIHETISDNTVAKNSDISMSDNTDKKVAESTDEKILDNTDEIISDKAKEMISDKTDENILDKTDTNISDKADEKMSDNTDENMPDKKISDNTENVDLENLTTTQQDTSSDDQKLENIVDPKEDPLKLPEDNNATEDKSILADQDEDHIEMISEDKENVPETEKCIRDKSNEAENDLILIEDSTMDEESKHDQINEENTKEKKSSDLVNDSETNKEKLIIENKIDSISDDKDPKDLDNKTASVDEKLKETSNNDKINEERTKESEISDLVDDSEDTKLTDSEIDIEKSTNENKIYSLTDDKNQNNSENKTASVDLNEIDDPQPSTSSDALALLLKNSGIEMKKPAVTAANDDEEDVCIILDDSDDENSKPPTPPPAKQIPCFPKDIVFTPKPMEHSDPVLDPLACDENIEMMEAALPEEPTKKIPESIRIDAETIEKLNSDKQIDDDLIIVSETRSEDNSTQVNDIVKKIDAVAITIDEEDSATLTKIQAPVESSKLPESEAAKSETSNKSTEKPKAAMETADDASSSKDTDEDVIMLDTDSTDEDESKDKPNSRQKTTSTSVTSSTEKSSDPIKRLEDLVTIAAAESVKRTLASAINEETKKDDAKKSKIEKRIVIKECVNIECKSKRIDDHFPAPMFILNFFNVPKKLNRIQYVCHPCFDIATIKYASLKESVVAERPLLLETTAQRNDICEVFDSDEESDDNKDDADKLAIAERDKPLPKNVIDTLLDNLVDVIGEMKVECDLDKQAIWSDQIIAHKFDSNDALINEINDMCKDIQKRADRMNNQLYRNGNYVIEDLPPLDLNTMKQMQLAGATYPPHGELKYPKLETYSLYYAVRSKLLAAWVPCKIVEEVPNTGSTISQKTNYKVKFLRSKGIQMKIVLANNIAYGKAPSVRLQVGVRVIALFQIDLPSGQPAGPNQRASYFPGVIAEPLQSYNSWRYLIFFDDGYAQYVPHDNIRVICEASNQVWEDVHPDSAAFIENYLLQYKTQRPMVQVRKGQRMITEWNGKWLYAKVHEIDASLVQMSFEDGRRIEWIYRGSTRLGPLFNEKQSQKTSVGLTKRNVPYVEYLSQTTDSSSSKTQSRQSSTVQTSQPTTSANAAPPSVQQIKPAEQLRRFQQMQLQQQQQQQQQQHQQQKQLQQQQQQQKEHQSPGEEKRAVAKKSTSTPTLPPSARPTIQHMNNSTIYVDEDNRPKGKVVYYTAKKHMPPRKFQSHQCNPACLYDVKHNLSSYSPLAKPLLSGWERQISRSKNRKIVVYRSPCGRRLRNMGELHQYLRMTKCPLNVENFDFDFLIHCLAEYVIDTCIYQEKDISDGKESMAVPCVNYYDNTRPPACIYSARRIPTDGVNLELDTNFLCGCDCEDDCLDKTKCQCWQLTIAGARFGNPNSVPENVGYEFKRLPDPVPTGIYECNSRCKCAKTCMNRVAQHSIQLKLQIFKTGNRGWGLRCLNDVPKGSFICIYAGDLLTEQNANEAGDNYGDEYFAELDYIEVAENLKEGYEPDVVNDDDLDDDEYQPDKAKGDDSDDDEFVAKTDTPSTSVRKTRYNTRNSSIDSKSDDKKAKKDKKKDGNDKIDPVTGEVMISDEDEERQPISFVPNAGATSLEKDNATSKYKSIRKLYGKNEYVYIMDAKKRGNIGRYFNHSCSPNLFVQNVFVDTHDLRFPWVAFFALSHIRAGTELTWNYNYDVGSVPGKVLYCQCGSEACRGRLL